MKRLLAFFLMAMLLASNEGRCADGSLVDGQRHLLAGHYDEAIEILEPLAVDNPDAAIALARALEAQGRRDEAAGKLKRAGQGGAVQAELARLALARGEYVEAKSLATKAIEAERGQILARFILAELNRTSGQLKEAEQGYQHLIRRYNESDIEQPESLCWIALAAAQSARGNRLSDQFDFLVNELYPDAVRLSDNYWPADYGAGLLLMEKYNFSDAAKRFHAALAKNPNAAEVHAALARLALRGHDLDGAKQAAATALKINPESLPAWLVEADLAWANFRPDQALETLNRHALKLHPTDEETLARVGACYVLLDGPAATRRSRLEKLEADVLKRNSKPADFYFTLGTLLSDRNRREEAAHYLNAAIAAQPRLVGPHAELGQLAMRAGREDDACKLLEEASKADPFNVRVHNMLEVLEVLKGMQRSEGKACVVCYSPDHDRLLAKYAARFAEEEYPKLCAQFGYVPPQKPWVEIFNEAKGRDGREWFGARMTGLPYVGVAAATTGGIVGMVSPQDARSPMRYNWARALRHELVHVITLQKTRFNIPHWLTEGLAVANEGGPPPRSWQGLLLTRLASDKLYDLETINFGFMRPTSGDDWQLAYCQAELYVAFMSERFDAASVEKLVAAYADGLDTPQAIERTFALPPAEFEKQHQEYLREKTRGYSSLAAPAADDVGALVRRQREKPDDADAAADAAFALLTRNADVDAREAATHALRLKPNHPLATYVVVRLKLKAATGRDSQALTKPEAVAEAIAALEACLDRRSPQPNLLGLLAKLKQQTGRLDEAERLFVLGEQLDNVNLAWTKSLARLYLETGNVSQLTVTLERLAEADSDDLATRKKLAELAIEKRDYAQAVRWAREAIEIEVGSSDVHRQYGQALAGLGKNDQAVEEFEAAVAIDPEEPFLRFALADTLLQTRQTEKAVGVLEELIERAPDYPGAEVLLESLREK